jgi:phosphoribulokinase
MKKAVAAAEAQGNKNLSHFGPDANEFDKIEKTFKDYGTTGQCDRRYYIHSDEEAVEHNARLNSNLNPGEFTPWEKVGAGTDLLFYEGLHGAVVADGVNTSGPKCDKFLLPCASAAATAFFIATRSYLW